MKDRYESYELPISPPKPMMLPGTYPVGEPWRGEYIVAYAFTCQRLKYEYAILEPEWDVFI